MNTLRTCWSGLALRTSRACRAYWTCWSLNVTNVDPCRTDSIPDVQVAVLNKIPVACVTSWVCSLQRSKIGVLAENCYSRALRTCGAKIALWSGRTFRSCRTYVSLRTCRTDVALRSCWAKIALRTSCTLFTLRSCWAKIALRSSWSEWTCRTYFTLNALWSSWANVALRTGWANVALRTGWANVALRTGWADVTFRTCRSLNLTNIDPR